MAPLSAIIMVLYRIPFTKVFMLLSIYAALSIGESSEPKDAFKNTNPKFMDKNIIASSAGSFLVPSSPQNILLMPS